MFKSDLVPNYRGNRNNRLNHFSDLNPNQINIQKEIEITPFDELKSSSSFNSDQDNEIAAEEKPNRLPSGISKMADIPSAHRNTAPVKIVSLDPEIESNLREQLIGTGVIDK